jgi:hypothetical protein
MSTVVEGGGLLTITVIGALAAVTATPSVARLWSV